MLTDPKSSALVGNFAGQWLYLRNLRTLQPNSLEFPDFDDNLRYALQRETELFFNSIVREDRNVLDLMTADYTFLNERLAKHYNVPNVYGSHFRRVTLADEARRGLLGKGAILMVTSHADRTSPVVRGKWVLDNLLSAPVPPMPANVPPLDENANRGGRILTMRERMEEHRKNPTCNSCHRVIDPLGLALENYDPTGAWRIKDNEVPVDPVGTLYDGTRIDGPDSLRAALLKYKDAVVLRPRAAHRVLRYVGHSCGGARCWEERLSNVVLHQRHHQECSVSDGARSAGRHTSRGRGRSLGLVAP
jgi:hypothetical protein